MRVHILISLLFVAGFGLVIVSCDQTGLRGSNAQSPPASSEAGGDSVPEACVEGDQIVLRLPEAIESCMNQGRLYNFAEESCLEVTDASFTCSFDAMAAKVEQIGVDVSSIQSAQAEGALLVACGEKNSGNTIVAQWYYPLSDTDRCADENPISRIVTACYKVHGFGERPPLDTSEERDAALQACLKE